MVTRRISKAGKQTDAGIACPKCGGTQFKAKRSATAKTLGVVTFGVGAALAPKSQVKCVTCGKKYFRG